jgi:hypothetical protein
MEFDDPRGACRVRAPLMVALNVVVIYAIVVHGHEAQVA